MRGWALADVGTGWRPDGAQDAGLAELAGERRHLMNLGYRMLGTVADAEEAVQETYVRWYRLTPEDRDAVDSPRAWLTRVAGRICLDMLGSARARRERYVGEWLPEPLPGSPFAPSRPEHADPADTVTLDETVSTALLVVLESLTPAERVAFVLREVFAMPYADIAQVVGRSPEACRQLASAARRHVREGRSREATRERHDVIVRAFADACRGGSLSALASVLDPDVVLKSDGGGIVSAARRPVIGVSNVSRFLLGIVAKNPGLGVEERETGDGIALAFRRDGRTTGVMNLNVVGDAVKDVWIVLNPGKLGLWN
ncbi:RNA polymerase sigma factor (sigma-70 family) [Arthrobacter pascens]|uniref:RNA polymerase sigma factor SigJ n=1 Tax=Arthrobacter pascens TaxID=1677 RepID=UPI00278FAFC5|nr:RNA polymerase sigma factor SigJ [Arthrobacter pascens]MDQ0677317.1 RNA polymerase sigma factor (sigma-70 family) [Arthrobacter pascens]